MSLSPQLKWNRAHPEAIRAHGAVRHAIRAGNLDPQPCRICGGAAEAHHDDYGSPLVVTWLCRFHHRRLHARGPGDLIAGVGIDGGGS
ncbi:hypothetical protein IHQ68_10135 [Chelatococcus sambhunathii]|uniref:Recombination enhancement, RecA-dependent nuclease n=1 Tax=Chelatococcus sambhunathii TaxID=363953 RepID=A0ABU1DFV2_9HYPH|nr:hypothetical protein [Chelatococcus sambhunathii]MDR4306976.1 hypothetical protein [Chelatococcus sambhunathii]